MIGRAQMMDEIRDRLWRVLSTGHLSTEAASPDLGTGIDRDSLRDLSYGIFSISEQLGELLIEIKSQLRSLPSRSVLNRSETDGFVRGTVHWEKTLQLRTDRGVPTLFVDFESNRSFDYLRSQALKFLLHRVLLILKMSPIMSTGLQEVAVSRRRQIDALLSHTKLSNVRRLNAMSESRMAKLEARADGQTVAYWIRFTEMILHQQDRKALSSLFAENLLAPSKDDFLFELLVGFRIASFLESINYRVQSMQFLPQTKKPFGVLTRDDDVVTLWYQRSIGGLFQQTNESHYAFIRESNGLIRSSLRPDFVISASNGKNYIIEVKHSAIAGTSHIRAGITDAMAYLVDTPSAFSNINRPKAIVVASDCSASPTSITDIAVASQDSLPAALQLLEL